MDDLRDAVRARRRTIALALAAIVFLASVVPLPPREAGLPTDPLGIATLDKWVHALTYAVLAASFVAALDRDDAPSLPALAFGLALALAHGAVTELAQASIATRSFELADLVADAIGALAYGAWRVASRLRRRR